MPRDIFDLRGQEEDAAEKSRLQEIDQKRENDDWRWLMKGPRGRSVVWRLLADAGVFRGTWDTNAMRMSFNEGRRDYGTRLWAKLQLLCPGDVVKMQEEASSGSNDDGNAANSN